MSTFSIAKSSTCGRRGGFPRSGVVQGHSGSRAFSNLRYRISHNFMMMNLYFSISHNFRTFHACIFRFPLYFAIILHLLPPTWHGQDGNAIRKSLKPFSKCPVLGFCEVSGLYSQKKQFFKNRDFHAKYIVFCKSVQNPLIW